MKERPRSGASTARTEDAVAGAAARAHTEPFAVAPTAIPFPDSVPK